MVCHHLYYMLEDSIEYNPRLDSENGADLYTINISGIGTKVVDRLNITAFQRLGQDASSLMDSKDVSIGLDQYWLDSRILVTVKLILSRDNDRDGAGDFAEGTSDRIGGI
jgi:hypothetical protein